MVGWVGSNDLRKKKLSIICLYFFRVYDNCLLVNKFYSQEFTQIMKKITTEYRTSPLLE